ncbi:MAG TPA: Fic family protein [Paludibacteraceae bacterium]|jgi:Fic family protein|nr:Fic family protein [Paludibacteraceae bacterium]
MNLLSQLLEEKMMGLKGGLYHQTQIRLAFNSNRIEGSRLSEEQTRYIYETNTLHLENGDSTANVNDIIETVNHFLCFDYMLDVAREPLSEIQIKEFHRLLKNGTSDARKTWFRMGEYKSKPNVVGGIETSLPKDVHTDMRNLLNQYHQKESVTLQDIVDFHYHFEAIHPFQDGNGRVGRLIIFKECLANNILPFIIEDENKFFYYRGLKEYPRVKEFLTDTCLSAQDDYLKMVEYFTNK